MHCEVDAVAFVVDYGFFSGSIFGPRSPYIANMLSICAGIAVSLQ
jgi:hypothetical protein